MGRCKLDIFDLEAEREAEAMGRSYKSRTCDFGKRIKKFRTDGSDKVPTGHGHRAGGWSNNTWHERLETQQKWHERPIIKV